MSTTGGRAIFTGVDTGDEPTTHQVTIRFDSCVSPETWVELDDGTRLDILLAEDWEERHEYLFLWCRATGSKDKVTSRL